MFILICVIRVFILISYVECVISCKCICWIFFFMFMYWFEFFKLKCYLKIVRFCFVCCISGVFWWRWLVYYKVYLFRWCILWNFFIDMGFWVFYWWCYVYKGIDMYGKGYIVLNIIYNKIWFYIIFFKFFSYFSFCFLFFFGVWFFIWYNWSKMLNIRFEDLIDLYCN